MFFFRQRTAYELRISDWSSDVGSSDLRKPLEETRSISISGCAATKPARRGAMKLLPNPSDTLIRNCPDRSDPPSVLWTRAAAAAIASAWGRSARPAAVRTNQIGRAHV